MMSERGYESASKVWNGKDILGIFHGLGITAETFSILKVHQLLPHVYTFKHDFIILIIFLLAINFPKLCFVYIY